VIHPAPREMGERPYDWESFGLHAGTVQGFIKRWLARADELELGDVAVHALHDCGDPDESGRDRYEWMPVTSASDAAGAVMIAVSPELATYDPEIGFVPEVGGSYRARELPPVQAQRWQPYAYHLEPFERHAMLVLHGVRAVWADLDRAAARLERRAGWPEGTLHKAVELVALLHDVGKLSQ